MSRRSFDYAHPRYGPLQVVAGWDRPLQHFFITLEHYRPLCESERYLFDNLDSSTWPLPGPYIERLLIGDIRGILEHFRIPIPLNFIVDLLDDAQFDVGSYDQQYRLPERVR